MDDTVLHNMKIPIDWVCSYRQIQFLLMEYGISAIAGCDNVCNNKNKNIIQLWNLFKNAVYVYNTDDIEQANRIYNFIVDNLKNYEDIIAIGWSFGSYYLCKYLNYNNIKLYCIK